ncbi:11941_t:CDS:1, partial [Gigaspora margarita]
SAYVDEKFEFTDRIKNVNYIYAFEHFVKKLYLNVGNFDKFNRQFSMDSRIQYSLNSTSEIFEF